VTVTEVICRDDHNASPISLDVGGTVYTASRAVLKAVPDSWLARVVNGHINLPRNANDIRFIERDSQVRSQTLTKRASFYCDRLLIISAQRLVAACYGLRQMARKAPR
jgi:hypothetical protein